jgi:glutaredoxin
MLDRTLYLQRDDKKKIANLIDDQFYVLKVTKMREFTLFHMAGCEACKKAISTLKSMESSLREQGLRLRIVDVFKEHEFVDKLALTTVPVAFIRTGDSYDRYVGKFAVEELSNISTSVPRRVAKREHFEKLVSYTKQRNGRAIVMCAEEGSKEEQQWEQHCAQATDSRYMRTVSTLGLNASLPHVVLVTPEGGARVALETADLQRDGIFFKLEGLGTQVP